MAQFPALPLWSDAFIADTTHLSAEETGGYIMLLMCAWRRPDCDLPDDDVLLQRWSRIDARRWPKVRDRIMSFWTLNNGRWTQKRLVKEHEYVSHRRSIKSDNAKSKWLKNKETADATALRNGCETDAPTPTPIPNNIPPTPRKRGSDDDPGFERFWSAYPKREGRADALKAWKAAIKKATPDTIIAAATRYAEQCTAKHTEAGFIKLAGGWLRSERWADFPPDPKPDLLTIPAPHPPAETDDVWRARAGQYHGDRPGWRPHWGPRIGERGCRCPEPLKHLFKTGE